MNESPKAYLAILMTHTRSFPLISCLCRDKQPCPVLFFSASLSLSFTSRGSHSSRVQYIPVACWGLSGCPGRL